MTLANFESILNFERDFFCSAEFCELSHKIKTYAIKDKNGKIQIRRKKAEKIDSEEKEPEQPQPAPEESSPPAKERKKKTL